MERETGYDVELNEVLVRHVFPWTFSKANSILGPMYS